MTEENIKLINQIALKLTNNAIKIAVYDIQYEYNYILIQTLVYNIIDNSIEFINKNNTDIDIINSLPSSYEFNTDIDIINSLPSSYEFNTDIIKKTKNKKIKLNSINELKQCRKNQIIITYSNGKKIYILLNKNPLYETIDA